MKPSLHALAAFVSLLSIPAPTLADTTFDAPGNFNPIVPGYFADPTIKRFGDTFYLYATTDGNGGGRGPATVWVSKDFGNWVLVPMNWPTTPFYWAPDVAKRPDGHYYLFYNQPCNTFAGVSDTPIGPWTPVTPGDGLVIKDHLVKDVITLDTQLFEDKDGTLYGYWGTWGIFPNSGCGFGVFNPDMKSFARLGMIPNTQAKDFFEGPFMMERNGVYYLMYSSGSCHDSSYRVQYAVSTRPDGEFKLGANNPILASSADGKVDGPGHHSVLQQGDEYLIVYHRHDIPLTPNGMHRQTCADRLVFESDGAIKRVVPTHQGIGLLGPKSRSANLAFAKPVTASSFYQDTVRKHSYKPEYAVDDNNATLWRPADNRMGHWLMVDLGSAEPVRRTETQFEYGTWFYQYLIETSLDGQTWKIFADRRQNTRWGSPMVDDGEATARYLRITVTGTEYPGLFGALWNFKAFADSPPDPLLALADRAFAQCVASKPHSGRGDEAPSSPGGGSQSLRPSAPANQLLIHLDVSDLQLGAPVAAWTNSGSLGGQFTSGDAKPMVGMAGGRKAVRFSGKQLLTGSRPAPRSLAGNSRFTVAAWVNNPEIAESECIVSWAGRGGPDGATAQFGYGSHPEFGAVGHWGFADMGFGGAPPKAGQWHHLAVVFDGVIERVYVDGQLNHSRAKMLMMNEGRPIYVGASEPGTEYFDGFLASLRIYADALSEGEVKKLSADGPSADVLVHVESGRLDYGPLKSWANAGSLGGAFTATDKGPAVGDEQGRIAARFGPGEGLELAGLPETPLGDFTLLVGGMNPTTGTRGSPVQIVEADGTIRPLLNAPPFGGWRQIGLVYRGGRGTAFLDGAPTTQTVPPAPRNLKSILLGGETHFSGALTRVQLFRRALTDEEVAQLHQLWKQEWQAPAPNPAVFARPPMALWPGAVAMAAQPGHSDLGVLEYRFSRLSGPDAPKTSGWVLAPYFLDDNVQPNSRYTYSVTMRDPLGNVTGAAPAIEAATDATRFNEFTDQFQNPHDFLVRGAGGTIWDGFLSQADGSLPEAIAASQGVLRLQSKGTVWDGGKPLGAFLFKVVPGDFVAQATVSDYAGLATRHVPGNNDGGLMVRVPKAAQADSAEKLVQLNFFPIWNQGNMVTSLDGGRSQKGNGLAWGAHRHLQIIRQGTIFHFRTSADGTNWQNLPGSPVERKDMAGAPLQIGLYHASYGGESSYIAFSDFRLTTRK